MRPVQHVSRFAWLASAVALAAASAAEAQVRRQPPRAQQAPIQIALEIGSRSYAVSGQGECRTAPKASIYGLAAALYSVSYSSGAQSLDLTVWRPASGAADMLSLHFSDGSKRYEVDTVKAGTKRATKGSGKATFEREGAGGVFKIDAVSASGEKVVGKIHCGGFAGIQAEGG